MKFVTSSEHRDFFHVHHAIEFDELLNPKQLAVLNSAIDEELARRLDVPIEKIHDLPPNKLFMAGRDLWRENSHIKKVVAGKQFAELAAELAEQKVVRLGYDQLIPELKGRIYRSPVSDAYHQFLSLKTNLAGMSSFDSIACGLILCLKGDGLGPAEAGSIFSHQPGNGIFLHFDYPIDFRQLNLRPMQRYLFIVYARTTANYVQNEMDPHTHGLRQFGYVFGQKLTDKYHPTLYR